MTDVLYVLKDGTNESKELRLSLRSLEKNCKDLGEVYICTDRPPDWLQNVKHIYMWDSFQEPEKSVFNKVLSSINSDIGKDFLFMNEDFYMMKPFNASEYPYYHRGKMVYIDNPSRWQKVDNKTIRLLESDYDTLDYRIHCPMLMSKDVLSDFIPFLVDCTYDDCGYSIRCLYGNIVDPNNKKKVIDCKLWRGEPFRESETGCISTMDGADDILLKLEEKFEKKSKYEK